jgi:hypothetical protein
MSDTLPPLRIVNGRLRWHRLIHRTLGCPLGGSPDLARLMDLKWRLAQEGIPCDVVSEWLPWTATSGGDEPSLP